MLSITLLFTSLLAGFVAAQNSTSNFNAQSVDLTTRNQWCAGETGSCPMLCGGQSNTKMNRCDGATLSFTCTCANNSSPASIDQYLDTVPNHICQQQFADCREATPGSEACKTCGTLVAKDVPQTTMTSSAAATSDAAAATTGAEVSPSSPVPTTAGNGVGSLRGDGIVGGVMAGLAAAVLL